MKKITTVLTIILILCAVLSGCDDIINPFEEPDEPISGGDIGGGLVTRGIVFDFSYGSAEEKIEWYTLYGYDYGDISEDDAEVMSSWSGLDFIYDMYENEDGLLIVDWKSDSSLVLGYPPENQQDRIKHMGEEAMAKRKFEDVNFMRWFMMDSVRRNIDGEVYYTMDGGKELKLDGLDPVDTFPSDMPYMGSAFYFAHADNRGD